MIDRICVVLEGLSIAVCLHRLYGKKFRFDIATVSLITIEMIMMQAIDYFGWPSILSELFAPFILIYCVIEFGFDLKKLIVNNILNAVIICILQVIMVLVFYIFRNRQVIVGIGPLISNSIILAIIVFIFPKFRIKRFVALLEDKEKVLTLSLAICITITMLCVFDFKKINIIDYNDLFQRILFTVCIIMMALLTIKLGKYKIRSKEVETELRMHELYADSFNNLIDNIRFRQHEFDNHINTIYSQHYIYNTYEELIEAQKNYCQMVTNENQFNKLLISGNPIIIGFLYGKFNEISRLGINIEYSINIKELRIGIPIFKIVEVLGNLIGNAVEALLTSRKYNKLYIFMEEKDEILTMEVRNENDYINYWELELFFTKGYSKKGENRGIGLFHVKNICSEYNLHIYCQNKDVNGTNWITFSISNKDETI